MGLNIQKVQVVWMGFGANLDLLSQQGPGELVCLIIHTASSDAGVDLP